LGSQRISPVPYYIAYIGGRERLVSYDRDLQLNAGIADGNGI
ncbi:hypothetical protein LCGC14_2918010, partial [marine sediment metagenome]